MTASALLVEPAYRCAPPFSRTLGPEVADLAALADFAPDPEQELGLDILFAFDERGKSAAFEFAVVCARQNLKTGLFKQAALGWLFVTDVRLVVWSAHEFNTANEAFRDMEQLLMGCAALERRVSQIHRGAAYKAIELVTGQRLVFKARTKSGGRGLTGDKVVLDEAFALQPEHMGALLPTLSVVPDPQVVYGSSAGLATSGVLRGIRDRGRSGSSPRLGYLEWAAREGDCVSPVCEHAPGTPGCLLDDETRWAEGNPLLGRTRANGTGLTLEYLRAERQALPPAEFARERLGRWDEPGAVEAVFGEGRWQACVAPRPSGRPSALGLAVAFDQSAASIGAASVSGGGVDVMPLEHRPGTGWLAASAAQLAREYGVDVAVDERGPAAFLIPPLRDAGVPLRLVSTAGVLDACASVFDRVQAGVLRHGGYPELDEAVAAAVKRPVGDRWAWGRRASGADISVLEAVTLAVWLAGESVADPMVAFA